MSDLVENRFTPLYIGKWFTGLWCQRSPLQDGSTVTFSRYYGGRPDVLIDGVNVELTNRLTLARRPGCIPYSSATFAEAVNSFYAFKQFTTNSETITLMVDGTTTIYSLTPAARTTVMTKSPGASSASFLGVGNTLYIGDGVDQQAWDGVSATTRNWGVAMNGSSDTEYAGTGVSGSTGGSFNQGPYSGTAVIQVPIVAANPTTWGGDGFTPINNALVLDGLVTSAQCNLGSSDDFSQDQTNYLQVTGFNFNVPTGATITGIVANANCSGGVNDNDIRLLKSGSFTGSGTSLADLVAWQGSKTWGDSANLWGTTWTAAEVNDSGFGLSISACQNPPPTFEYGGGALTASVDYVSITVYYTTPVVNSWTNPSNVVGAPDATYTTASSGPSNYTAPLTATNYSLTAAGAILGIQVSVRGHVSGATSPLLTVQLQDNNGNLVGNPKTVNFSSTTDATVVLGSSADLWGSQLNGNAINMQASFGVQIAAFDTTGTFFIDSAQIEIWDLPVPIVTPEGSGSFAATTGYGYLFEYRNSLAGDTSNASATANTGSFASKADVAVTLTASPDPQVNEIWVFRTTDGGSTYFSLPTNPYPNTSTTITDDAADSELVTTVLAARASQNTVPPAGISGMVYHMGKVWGFVGNVLYYSSGSDLGNILGNGNEGFPPLNNFVYPARITCLVPTAVGLIVFTVSDIHIVYGNGSATAASVGTSGINVFYSVPLLSHIGLLSRFALAVNGTTIYFQASDNQVLSLDPDAGVSEIGYPVGAPNFAYPNEASLTQQITQATNITSTQILSNVAIYTASNSFSVGQSVTVTGTANDGGIFNVVAKPIIAATSTTFSIALTAVDFPLTVDTGNATTTIGYNPQNTYVTWHVQGSQDKAVFIADGINGWFRCNTSLAPEGNFVWSPKANVVGGCKAVQSIETSPGTYQLLIGPGDAGGLVLVRNLNVFSDNNNPYPANFKMGSIVLAEPGEIAEVAFITGDFNKIGTSPSLSVLLNEVSGTFESISKYVHQDPPSLYGVTLSPNTLFANRYELLQTVDANPGQNPIGAFCRHFQIEVDFGSTDTVQNELLDLTVFGALYVEK